MPKKTEEEALVKSLSIPKDVRDMIAAGARARGISSSAMMRLIVDDYVAGNLAIETREDPEKIVRTSVYIPKKLWAKFSARTERENVPTQQVVRAWFHSNQG